MPTYAYRCATCEHSFEQYQAFTDDSLTECPSCGASTLRKVFNSIGVTFNGSGFYRTDSRGATDGAKKSTDASGTKASDAAGSSSSGTPASKPTPAAASTPA